MKFLLASLGIITFLCSVWGGAYLIHLLYHSWAEYPIVITTILCCIGGIALFAYAVSFYEPKQKDPK